VPKPPPAISPVTDAEKWLEQQFTSEQEALGTPITTPEAPVAPPMIKEKVEEENPLAALYGPPAAEGPAAVETVEPEAQAAPAPTIEAPAEEQVTEEGPAFSGLEGREEAPPEIAETPAFPESSEGPLSGLTKDFAVSGEPTAETISTGEETFTLPSEDPFGLTGARAVEETPSAAEPAPAEALDQGAGFGPLAEAAVEAPGTAGETFAEFSERIAGELSGTDNTMSFEEYLAVASGATGQPDQFEQLAERLKGAGRITPVINLSEHTTTPASEAETGTGTGFVTPTLAEIYAKQGWYDDAIKAYRTLAVSKPTEKEKYEERIKELEAEKKKQEG
jgi:hypothetical protein